jgi:exopolyphosphatase/guanosine-5'-triphosphate,3'-diphosphate pyrophosphatase
MFFTEDPPSRDAIQQFTEFVGEKIGSVRSRTRPLTFDRVIVTAATAAAVVRAIHSLPASGRDQIDRLAVKTRDVRELFRLLAGKSLRERQVLEGIGSRRAEIIVAGCGALALILEAMGAESCSYSSAGVRDGVIADLAMRASQFDQARLDAEQRESVRSLAVRCNTDLEHVDRVALLAGRLFDNLAPLHGLGARYGGLLEAGAYLHDIGHFISSTRHHRHSFYIVSNSDLPAFETGERLFVANLCRYHRKNMPKPGQDNFRDLEPKQQEALLRLIPILRIADSLDRSHRRLVEGVSAKVNSDEVTIRIEANEDAALEAWAVRQHGDVFGSVYGKKLKIAKD